MIRISIIALFLVGCGWLPAAAQKITPSQRFDPPPAPAALQGSPAQKSTASATQKSTASATQKSTATATETIQVPRRLLRRFLRQRRRRVDVNVDLEALERPRLFGGLFGGGVRVNVGSGSCGGVCR